MPPRLSVSVTLLVSLFTVRAARADNTMNVMLTGYWPPTNEMLRPFSTDPTQNPGGWAGADWEGRGYDIHAFFPECPAGLNPGACSGDFEVDYQDTSADWWRITAAIQPVAIISFSRGFPGLDWEVEVNQLNRGSDPGPLGWYPDYRAPTLPIPIPPDGSVPAYSVRPSTLPVDDIANAVAARGLGLNARVDSAGDGGSFLSEFIAYHGVWYQDMHRAECDRARSVAAGHVHVGIDVPVATAREAAMETLRVVLAHVDALLALPIDCTDPACAFSRDCAAEDHDGDGVPNGADCAPLDPGAFAVPGEVAQLIVERPAGIGPDDALVSWSDVSAAAGLAIAHDVVTGRIRDLRTTRDLSGSACLSRRQAATDLIDSRVAGVDSDGFYYLVRAINACGLGTHGSAYAVLDAASPCD